MFRAREVGAINDVRFKTLFIELSRRGERKNEKINIPLNNPTLFKKIIKAYENDLGFSRKQIAEDLVGVSEDEFIEWFDLEPFRLKVVLN